MLGKGGFKQVSREVYVVSGAESWDWKKAREEKGSESETEGRELQV